MLVEFPAWNLACARGLNMWPGPWVLETERGLLFVGGALWVAFRTMRVPAG